MTPPLLLPPDSSLESLADFSTSIPLIIVPFDLFGATITTSPVGILSKASFKEEDPVKNNKPGISLYTSLELPARK
jgi:hypothetical protein